MASEFFKELPKQIPTDRFVRTIITAIHANPALATADRTSLKLACMKAAEDGLLPDGREGALVIYNTEVKDHKTKTSTWVKKVQWLPMVWGLCKKARNTGEVAKITAHVVFRHDHFRMIYGDDELFEHEAPLDVPDEDMVEANAIGAYAIATMKDGTKVRAWRHRRHIMLAKAKSKAQDGMLWTTFWEEGWQKTAIRYLNKYLPSSQELQGFAKAAERDDELADMNEPRDVTPKRGRLEQFVHDQRTANGDDLGETEQEDEQEDESEYAPEAEHIGQIPITWPGQENPTWYESEAAATAAWNSKSYRQKPAWVRAMLNRNPELEQLLEPKLKPEAKEEEN
jgi:recombination protein RecT